MAHTVKEVSAISGVSVRTLHFYDETDLLKPAFTGANGYRYYEEAQLLKLQQILFYRELGFELKEIKRILGRPGFEIASSLESHRKVLEETLTRTRTLMETIDKTVNHLKGRKMKSEEMFTGFSLPAGKDRFDERLTFSDGPVDCKVSGKDTDGALCVFEVAGGWPRHMHHDQDVWLYVIEGEVALEIGQKRIHVGAGESAFVPRKVEHAWVPIGGKARIITAYQPAGRIEAFYRTLRDFTGIITAEQLVAKTYSKDQVDALNELFKAHGMDLTGPPLQID